MKITLNILRGLREQSQIVQNHSEGLKQLSSCDCSIGEPSIAENLNDTLDLHRFLWPPLQRHI